MTEMVGFKKEEKPEPRKAINKTQDIQNSNCLSKNRVRNFDLDLLDFEAETEDKYINNIEVSSNDYDNVSLPQSESFSIFSHRQEMLPLIKSSKSADQRENECIPFNFSNRIIIDSSSDEYNSDEEEEYVTSDQEDKYLETDDETNESEENAPMSEVLEDDDSQDINDQPNFFHHKIITCDKKRFTIQAFSSLKKKKKWDLQFIPIYPQVHSYLNDIGYITEQESANDCTSDAGSSGTSNSGESCITTFKVTCGSNLTRICQRVSVKSEEGGNFKMPLPPVKRPPSRPKRDSSLSVSPASSFGSATNTIYEDTSEKEDDTISLVASTIDLGHCDVDERAPVEAPLPYRYPSPESSLSANHDRDKRIESWIESNTVVLASDTFGMESDTVELKSDTVGLESDTVGLESDTVALERDTVGFESDRSSEKSDSVGKNGLLVMPPVEKEGSPRVYFKDVPSFYLGLCYFHFFNGKCKRMHTCKKQHTVIKDKYTNKCRNYNPNDLKQAYNVLLLSENLFKELFPCFMVGFGYHKLRKELIESIKDLFDKKDVMDIADGLEFVVRGLETSGQTFLEAIDFISYNVGFLQYPVLADYLIELILIKNNLSEYWEAIKRIAKARGYIAPDTVSRILAKATCIFPCDKQMCCDIFYVIIKGKMTDLAKVDESFLTPFRKLITFGNCSQTNSSPIQLVRPSAVAKPYEALYQTIDKNLMKEREKVGRMIDGNEWTIRRNCVGLNSTSGLNAVATRQETDAYIPERVVARNYQALVDHPSPPEVTLTPSRPIFGKAKYRSRFELDVSLHNLLPDSVDNIDITDLDVKCLDSAIKTVNGAMFYELMVRYKRKETLRNFITMILATFRSLASMYTTLVNLLDALKRINPDFSSVQYMKGMLEVVIFNILFDLEKRGLWEDAANLVERFCDWDSLISSQIFPLRKISRMGRYLYLALILTKGKSCRYLHLANEILQSQSLNLLENPNVWPHFYVDADLALRNKVLDEILSDGYLYNITVAVDLYTKIFSSMKVHEFNGEHRFNLMLERLIDERQVGALKKFLPGIDIFYKKMDKNMLRAFTIHMEQLETEKFRLYELCCERNIYVPFMGTEPTIVIRTNMLDPEIRLILLYYFKKRAERKTKDRFLIEIKLQDCVVHYPKIIRNCFRSIIDINQAIKRTLADCLGIFLGDSPKPNTIIEITPSMICNWLNSKIILC